MRARGEDAPTGPARVDEAVVLDPERGDLRLVERLAAQLLDRVAPELGDAHGRWNEDAARTIPPWLKWSLEMTSTME